MMMSKPRIPATGDVIAAALLTFPNGAAVEMVTRDGQRIRVDADEPTATALAMTLWQAIELPALKQAA